MISRKTWPRERRSITRRRSRSMKTRTKVFLWAPLVAALLADIISGKPEIFIRLLVVYGVGWVVWRGFLFIYSLVKPVRDKLKPYVDPINEQGNAILRRSGFDAVVDVSDKLQADLEAAADKTKSKP